MAVLERRLGLGAVVAISMSAMIGSGIFVLPGLAAAKTGPSVWMAYLLAGLAVLPAALSKAELATAMPLSGGTYVFLERAFGPLAGTVAGLGLWLSLLLKSAFALVGFAHYLWVLVDLPIVPTALVLLVGIVVLNIVGVRAVSRVQKVVVVISLGGLVALVVEALSTFQPALMVPEITHGGRGLLGAAAFVFVSYAGVTKVAAIAEEVRNPDRNLPAGMLISLAVMAALYAVVTLSLVGNIPVSELADDLRPIHTLAEQLAGPVAGAAAAVLGVLTMTSMANAGLLSASRFPFAMARDGLAPSLLAELHRRWLTPVPAIVLTGALMGLAIATLEVEKIAKLASAFMILLFVAVNVTVLVLRESRAGWYRPAYKSPLYPWTQAFGALAGLTLLAVMGLVPLAATVALIALGAFFYTAYGRPRVRRRGVLGLMGRRTELLRPGAARAHEELADALAHDADVAVPLLGTERSPETLVEIAAALAAGGTVEVLHVTEVPEQTSLTALAAPSPLTTSIARRVRTMAESQHLDLRWNAIVTRDVQRTLYAASARLHTRWLVLDYETRGGRGQGRILRQPMAWLLQHLACNLALFRDAGVRYVREILVYAEPGPHDALVTTTADQLAGVFNARLTFVRVAPPDAGAIAVTADNDYLHELRQLVSAPSRPVLLRGDDPLTAISQASAGYDLLILGAAGGEGLWTALRGSPKARMVRDASCSVLVLRTPQKQTHEVVAPPEAPLELGSLLLPEAAVARVHVSRKEALFHRVAKHLAGAVGVDARALGEALWEREHTQNTAVGLGVAIPHASLPGLQRTVLGVFTLAQPIDYHAADGAPVDVLFVLVGPPSDRHTHLEVLAALARLVLGTSLLDRLRTARTAEDILAAVRAETNPLATTAAAPPTDGTGDLSEGADTRDSAAELREEQDP